MEDRKYKHWVFTWNQEFNSEKLMELESFLKTFCKSYVFQEEVGEQAGRKHLQGYFETNIRKRQPTLLSSFAMKFEDVSNLTIQRMMGTKEEAVEYCTKTETRVSRPRTHGLPKLYEASDLLVFDNSARWYPWQKELMSRLFNKDLTIIEPDDRTIIWVQDLMGNSGKSKFVKHICYNYQEDTCKLAFGSSTQLRSACITAGARKIYFIDVPRTLGKDDDIFDIISVIEDIKNGFVVTSMYGKHQQLMFDPPHIVVFANVFCPQNTLSGDRLETYEIHHNKTMKKH